MLKFLAVLSLIAILAGCGSDSYSTTTIATKHDGTQVVTTTTVEGYWYNGYWYDGYCYYGYSCY